MREFFRTRERGGDWETNFIHADEAETSVLMLLYPDGVQLDLAEETEVPGYLPDGHFDLAVDPFGRPCSWSEGQGHFPIEMAAIPEGVVGRPTLGDPTKARRTVAAILSYLTLVCDEILQAFPAGTLPPVEEVTLRTAEEMEPYLKEPGSPGWRSVYALTARGFRT